MRLPLWWHLSALAGSARRSRGLWGDARAGLTATARVATIDTQPTASLVREGSNDLEPTSLRLLIVRLNLIASMNRDH